MVISNAANPHRHFSVTTIGGGDLELTADHLQELDDLLAKMPVQGNRYNEQRQNFIKPVG
jgi:hypothetical protein